jgi:uncharacterized protein (TIRG00374 family)
LTTPTNEKTSPVAQPGRRAPFQRAIEIVISLAFLVLALRGVKFEDLWAALRHASYVWLAPAILLTVLTLAIKAWRWQMMFRPEYRLPFGSVFTALSAGYLASNVLPARLGEVVSVVLLVSDEPVSVARTLSTLIVMRLLDLLSLLVILVGLLPFVRLPLEMTHAAQALGVMALFGAGAVVLLSFWRDALLGLAHRVLRHIRPLDRPGVYASLRHLVDGFATLRRRSGLTLIAMTLLAWASIFATAWACAQAFHLGVPLTAIIFANIVVALGMLVPSSPGYIGVFHYLVTVALAPFGVPKEAALGYAIVWHGINYLTLSVSGMVALGIHGTSLGQVLERWRGGGVTR